MSSSPEFILNTLQHKFPYIKDRPIITTRLGKLNGPAKYMGFLIDTGADFTLISRSSAFSIDLDYPLISSPEIKIEVANLATILAKQTELIITIKDRNLLIPVLIADQEVENLLGRKGIFDYYDITFQQREKQVIFEEV